MKTKLQSILDIIKKSDSLSNEDKESLIVTIKSLDKDITITEFKLDRTEKVKRTTTILLEETITELELKRKDIEEVNDALTKSISELRASQAQLIQAEKMASLGELTAGIAHEIQNPLNFVNNFSEVSGELLDELAEEIIADNKEEVKDIIKDLKFNLEKINHHGQRASGIVKGMLDHSRTSSGERVDTDINKLCDEYLRLSYHGLRAKDRTFNVKYETAFDESLPKINVAPQDIGRVILNLINNAFQAVDQRSKMNEEGYEPWIKVSTGILSLASSKGGNPHVSPAGVGQGVDRLQISIKDNVSGISPEIKDKIFQPFFTTKPSGQGTGLGLSLSYDIIKAHGGKIEVKTEEGKGTEFIITLPSV